jgi:hypothetical protein
MKKVIGALCALAVLGLGTGPTGAVEAEAGWTLAWHCQVNGANTHHLVNATDTKFWANGDHGLWPGSCEIHENSPE